MLRDIADGMERGGADLEGSLGYVVRHGENLSGLFIQQQMIVPKMAAAHVPVEVLGLYVQRKHVPQQFAQPTCDLQNTSPAEIRSLAAPPRYFSCSPLMLSLFNSVP